MNIILVLIPLSLILLAAGIWAFFWGVNHAQFDDLDTPALIPLADDPPAVTVSIDDRPFSRHSREGGNPVPALSDHEKHYKKELDSRLRGNDERKQKTA